jgi:hypothetical protein
VWGQSARTGGQVRNVLAKLLRIVSIRCGGRST